MELIKVLMRIVRNLPGMVKKRTNILSHQFTLFLINFFEFRQCLFSHFRLQRRLLMNQRRWLMKLQNFDEKKEFVDETQKIDETKE